MEVLWEAVRQARPEVLVLALCGFGVERAREDLARLQTYPGWAELPAVARGEVYVVDGSAYFSRPGPRLIDSLESLTGVLHPGVFSEFAPARRSAWDVVRLSEGPSI